jgi:hypothetical protein
MYIASYELQYILITSKYNSFYNQGNFPLGSGSTSIFYITMSIKLNTFSELNICDLIYKADIYICTIIRWQLLLPRSMATMLEDNE